MWSTSWVRRLDKTLIAKVDTGKYLVTATTLSFSTFNAVALHVSFAPEKNMALVFFLIFFFNLKRIGPLTWTPLVVLAGNTLLMLNPSWKSS